MIRETIGGKKISLAGNQLIFYLSLTILSIFTDHRLCLPLHRHLFLLCKLNYPKKSNSRKMDAQYEDGKLIISLPRKENAKKDFSE